MLLKPFGEAIKKENNPYTQTYVGDVVDIDDPKKLQRVKVLIDLWDKYTTDQLPWVKPKVNSFLGSSPNSASHSIPEVGSQVRVSFPNNDPDDPQYEGTEITEENKCAVFDEYYGKTYGNKDSAGNIHIVNKETMKTVHEFASGTKVQADKDGTVCMSTSDGSYVAMKGNGEIIFNASKIHFNATDEITMDATNVRITGNHNTTVNGDQVDVVAESGLRLESGAAASLKAKSTITLDGSKVATSNLDIMNGINGQIYDLTSGELYIWSKGILVSKAP